MDTRSYNNSAAWPKGKLPPEVPSLDQWDDCIFLGYQAETAQTKTTLSFTSRNCTVNYDRGGLHIVT